MLNIVRKKNIYSFITRKQEDLICEFFTQIGAFVLKEKENYPCLVVIRPDSVSESDPENFVFHSPLDPDSPPAIRRILMRVRFDCLSALIILNTGGQCLKTEHF